MIDLKDFHEQLLEILLEFDRVCKKNDIKYSLAFGTLLGAIRHKGFIPWDDDVDVMMDRKNFDKFCKICTSEIGAQFFFQSKETEEKYPYNLCRLRKNDTAMIYNEWKDAGIHLGIYIDIYPVDKIPDGMIKRLIQYFFIIVMTPIRISTNPVIFKTGGKKFNGIIKKIIYLVSLFCPKKICISIENYFLTKYADCGTKNMGIICEGGNLLKTPRDMQPFLAEYMSKYTEVEFEGHKLMTVTNPENLLKHWYGDYLKLPPESERKMFHQPDVYDTKKSYLYYISK